MPGLGITRCRIGYSNGEPFQPVMGRLAGPQAVAATRRGWIRGDSGLPAQSLLRNRPSEIPSNLAISVSV